MLLGQRVELRGPLGVARYRIRERLGDTDDVGAGFDRGRDLVGDLVEVARSTNAYDVGLLGQHAGVISGHRYVAVAPDRLAHGAPVLLGMAVDDADQIDLVRSIENVAEEPLAHHARTPYCDLDHADSSSRRCRNAL